ncbi:MAG: T9SS type A sorting domain-containing protein [Bacteroidota bacterium]
MKKILLAVAASACFFTSKAQWVFENTFGMDEVNSSSIATDINGNIYSYCFFYDSLNVNPALPNSYIKHPTYHSGGKHALSKYTPTGNLSWTVPLITYAGYGYGGQMALDNNGNSIVTGFLDWSDSIDLDPSAAKLVAKNRGLYMAKYNTAGNLVWGKNVEFLTALSSIAVATDATGNIFVTGRYQGTVDFDFSPTGTFTVSTGSDYHAYLAKYDANGNFLWVNTFKHNIPVPISNWNNVLYLKTDALGNAYIGCNYEVSMTLSNGTVIPLYGNSDMLIIKYDPTGSIIYSQPLGTSGYDYLNSIGVDKNNNLLIAGRQNAYIDFDISSGSSVTNGISEFFVKVDPNFGFMWAKHGDAGNTHFNSIGFTSNNDILVTGPLMYSFDFDLQQGFPTTYQLNSTSNSYDIFVATYDQNGNVYFAKQFGTTGNAEYGYTILADANDNLIFSGAFQKVSSTVTTDLNYSPASNYPNTNEMNGYCITKYSKCIGNSYTKTGDFCQGGIYTLPTGSVVIAAGTYTSNLKTMYYGCDSTIVTTVSMTPMPSLTITPTTSSVCAGSAVNFTVSGAGSYAWSTGSTSNVLTDVPTSSITYSVVGANGTCTTSISQAINVVAKPSTPVIAPTATLFCTGENTTLTGSGSAGNYEWFGPDSYVNTGTSALINFTATTQSGTYSLTSTNLGCVSDVAIININVSFCTGVKENQVLATTLYPNPFENVLTIKTATSKNRIIVVDVLGKVVYEKQVLANETEIDLSHLNSGFYQLIVESENNSYSQKIIKQ